MIVTRKKQDAGDKRRPASKMLLVVVWCLLGLQVLAYFRTRYELVSSLIPGSIVDELSVPFLYAAALLAPFAIGAAFLFRLRRSLAVIVLCVAGILLLLIGHQYALFRTVLHF